MKANIIKPKSKFTLQDLKEGIELVEKEMKRKKEFKLNSIGQAILCYEK